MCHACMHVATCLLACNIKKLGVAWVEDKRLGRGTLPPPLCAVVYVSSSRCYVYDLIEHMYHALQVARQDRQQSNIELTNEGTEALHHRVSHWVNPRIECSQVCQATCKALYTLV